MKKKLLIIEDETSLAKQLKWALNEDYAVTIAASGEKARPLITSKSFPVITMDLGLPPFPDGTQEGFALLEDISSLSPHSKVIVITGNNQQKNAIKAITLGAADFCTKPIDLNLLRIILDRTYRMYELEEAGRKEKDNNSESQNFLGMVGISDAIVKVFERIKQASKTDYPVLITGESGTGKEMAAQAIHALSQRAKKPMVVINCGAIPENLLESELFGHEKGAFTGALAMRIGRFEQAQGGTVFLDEIGDMPPALQVKILRFLQEKAIQRVGGHGSINLDVRVVAATNMDLEKAVEEGGFRLDLFHRLNVIPLSLPPLRERAEDILLLARHFLKMESKNTLGHSLSLSPAAISALMIHTWPGNIRELHNLIRRAVTVADKVIQPEDLGFISEHKTSPEGAQTLQEVRSKAEREALESALAQTGNNISRAAEMLDISRPAFYDLMRKHGISVAR